MPSIPSVAIVILNWNGKHFLEKFLPSVTATTYPNHRVIIADNSSTDDSIAFLKKEYPAVERIQLVRNFGFARGYNECLKEVHADYYMILNSDVEVTSNWLQPMVELLEQHPTHAACMPKLLSYNDKDHFEYAGACGGWIDTLGYPFSRGRIFDTCEKDEGQYDQVQEVFWASGAALLVRSAVYHQMHGFDNYFQAHQEEIDLCWRMQSAGYKIFCCPSSVVYHVGGGTLPKGASKKIFLNFRNNLVMLAKNLPFATALWLIPFRILLDHVAGLKSILDKDGGQAGMIWKAHFSFYGWLVNEKPKKRKSKKYALKKLKGVYRGAVVWQYFIRKKKLFSEIVH